MRLQTIWRPAGYMRNIYMKERQRRQYLADPTDIFGT
jgi:hypothetical protein